MLTPQTLNRGTGAPADTSSADASGSTTSQDDNGAKVDGQGSVDNSGSDGANGANGDAGDRQRPDRAQRRINELIVDARKANDLEAENARLREMLEQKPDYSNVKIPDLKDGEDITPEKYRADLLSAADQLVKLRMDQIIPEQNRNLTRRQANDRNLSEIDAVVKAHPELQADNEAYDSDLEEMLVDTFRAGSKGDPNYSFKALADQMFKLRKGAAKGTLDNQTTKTATDNRATGAIKSSGGPKAAANTKSDDAMSAKEYAAAHGLSFKG